MAKSINYAVFQQKLLSLKEKTEALLQETNNEGLAIKMKSELEMVGERKDLRLAFVGQYSSGKSTIIGTLANFRGIM